MSLCWFILSAAVSLPMNDPKSESFVSLDATLKPLVAEYGVPAIAAAIVKDGKVVAAGAAGTRRVETDTPVTINDRFHLGSDTKAMTALIAAMLVEEKKINWDTTVLEIFPELGDKMDSRLKTVTLKQLLSHSSGMPFDNEAFVKLIEESYTQSGNLNDLRYWLVSEWCPQPLEAEPGSRWAYSNMGYTLAGAMLERVSGKTWDELIVERVFEPLELKTAGLGCQSTMGKVDAPLGHREVDGKLVAFLAGPNGDNPPILGPAGIAHMSVLDFAQWAAWSAGEGSRGPKLVEPETFKLLHTMVIPVPDRPNPPPGTPVKGKYGLGVGEVVMPWRDEPILYHGGSNGMNLAQIWIDPKNDFAMVLVTNAGGKLGDDALFGTAPKLYEKWGPKEASASPAKVSE